MSNSLSVSAITGTLRTLLHQGTQDNPPGTVITTRPLDKARTNNTGNQLNVFLYQTALNAAWRNSDMPDQVRPGETGGPPLPLNLYYLLTAYGENDNDDLGHRVLGRAMSILHDHPVLSSDDIRLSVDPADLSKYDLQHQREGIRITYQPMTLDEMSKLWTAFQTEYRISAAYEVAVVLIDSQRPTRTPLPVLRQGDQDRGPAAQSDLTPPFPTLREVQPPDPRYGAALGDTLTLVGHHLKGDEVEVRLRHRLLDAPHVLPAADADDGRITVQVAADETAEVWPAGHWDVWVVTRRSVAGQQVERRTNELPLGLAPRVGTITRTSAPGAEPVKLVVAVTPQVFLNPPQRASLLIADREVLPEPPGAAPPARTDSLQFSVSGVEPGDYFVRLRVDGIDSTLAVRAADPPTFDDAQKVTI
jgi:hypothetical protein